jgi:hypothetical protein
MPPFQSPQTMIVRIWSESFSPVIIESRLDFLRRRHATDSPPSVPGQSPAPAKSSP